MSDLAGLAGELADFSGVAPLFPLPDFVIFPQVTQPLHIFEPRYREMLRDVLATNRLFAVAGLNPRPVGDSDQFEPPHRIASVGIVRACQKNENGTSNLLLQGLCRVEIAEIVAVAFKFVFFVQLGGVFLVP